ncbi:hypothetical protein HPB52_001897 [Rhipicephalus sanguineus]|uniref:Peptidase M13 N-terminal domain-containing protein n=1 Tax=Rhipicephalus sanguineus TaxID=34632 RepID=A0A9D4SZX8_RHISA|nr:hypothetical protein HPB52_001897 [Rhipicephalus sanguineus]
MSLGGRKRISSHERSSVAFKTGTFQKASTFFHYVPITESRHHTENPFPVRLVLSVMVIAILIIAIALVMAKMLASQNGFCTTLACREFAELARWSLNESVPPCEDFGRFVCGRWEKRKRSEASTRRLIYVTALEMIFKSLISALSPEERQSVRERVGAFFRSCNAVTRGHSDDVGTVRAYLEEAGVTWPLVPSNPDVMDTLLYLDSKLNWPSIIQFHVKEEKSVVKILGDAIFAEFNTKVFTTEVRHDLRNLVLAVRKSFVRRFSQSSFAKYISLVANWGKTDHVFFVLESHRHNGLEHAASSLPEMSDSFATNWRIASQRLRTLNASVGVLGEDVLSGSSMFRLDWEVMDFILSPFALVFPMYNFELTRAVKYATIGGQVGVAAAQLALGRLAQQPAAQFELTRSHQCVEKAFEKHAAMASTAVLELASLSSLSDALAESGNNDQRLPGLDNYSAVQTFFIAWCLMRCHDVSSRRDDDEPCSPVLRLFEAFAHAFQCWPGAYMNPSTKCSVFESPNATV